MQVRSIQITVLILYAVSVCSFAYTSEYESYGNRDPFVPLVGVDPLESAAMGEGVILSVNDVFLQGVVIGVDGRNSAIINGEVMMVGSVKDNMTVESIENNSVKVKIADRVHEIMLYTE